MRLSGKTKRQMLHAFSGNEYKFLNLLLGTAPGAYGRILLSLGEIERSLDLDRVTVVTTQKSLARKGVIRHKTVTDRSRAVPITAYSIEQRQLENYCSLFEIRCFHCGATKSSYFVEHHKRPRASGGADVGDNKAWVCANCHHAHHTYK